MERLAPPSLLVACALLVTAGEQPPRAHLPPPSPRATELLAVGDAAAEAGRWADAVAAYVELLEAGPDAVCAVGADRVVGARHLGRLRLMDLGPKGRKACREALDAEAAPRFAELRARRDVDTLRDFARLHGPSSYGAAAWDVVGDLAWERGLTGQALDAYRRAAAWGAEDREKGRRLSKVALCLARLGRGSEAERALRSAREHSQDPLGAGGQRLDGDRLERIASLAAPRVTEGPGQRLWRRALRARRSSQWPWTPVLPALGHGLVLVHGGEGVTARDEFTGETVWRYDPPVDRRVGMRQVYGTGAGGPMTVTVGESWVYASFVQPTDQPHPLHTRRRIHALAPAAGRPVYVLGEPSATEPLLGRMCFCAPPAEREGVVYALGFADTGSTDFYLWAFDAATGRPCWRRYLFSGPAPKTLYLGPGHSSPLTVADGAVYVLSNSGGVASVHAFDGTLRWARRYERTAGFWRTDGGEPIASWPGWRNAPRVLGETVVVVPCDAESVLGLDAETGAVRWRRPREGHAFVHGAGRGLIVLAGKKVEAVNVATGKTSWERGLQDPGTVGIGAIAGGKVVCPTQSGVLTLDLATGRQTASSPAIRGHVVPGRSTWAVANGHSLASHCQPTSVIARERGQLEASPEAAEPRYRLAIALRAAGRDAEAADHLREALERSAGQADPLVQRVRAAAWRLYHALGERAEAEEQHGLAIRRYRQAAAAAMAPARRARALLGEARCLRAQRAWSDLVALYQQLIEQRFEVLYSFSEDAWTNVSVHAERQIASLVRQHGRSAYAPFERAAEQVAAARPETAVRAYPNSRAALGAWRRLAEEAVKRGDQAEAARHLAARLRRLRPGSREAEAAARELLAAYEQAGDRAAARAFLESLGTDSAAQRLQSPRYEEPRPDPHAPVAADVTFPVVHRWTAKPAGLEPLSLVGTPTPGLAGRVFARDSHTLHCLDAATGEVRWRLALGQSRRTERGWRVRGHGELVLLYGGRHLFAVEPRTGAGRWTVDLGEDSAQTIRRTAGWAPVGRHRLSLPTFAFAPDLVFAATASGRVVALDAHSGESRWTAALPGRPLSRLARRGDRLLVATGPGCRVVRLDAATGRVIQIVRLRGRAPSSRPIWAGETLVMVGAGRAAAFDALSGERLWRLTPLRRGRLGVQRFGSRLVLLSSAGSLESVDAASGDRADGRRVGEIVGCLRCGADLFLFCRRNVGGAKRLTVEAYRGRDLVLRWFATLPSPRVYDAAATRHCLLISSHGAGASREDSRRQVLVLDRASGRRQGALDLRPFRPYALSRFVAWPRRLLATVHNTDDEVEAERLVAFASGPHAGVGDERGDPLLEALRQGRLDVDGRIALARRHAGRGAFPEALDLLDRGAEGADLADTEYLRLGDATARVRRQAIAAEPPQRSIYALDWELPEPIALDRFHQFDLAPRGERMPAGRWRGRDDLAATVHLAYTPTLFCLYAVVRDDVHRGGDALDLLLARGRADARQWGEGDTGLRVTAGGGGEVECWLGRMVKGAVAGGAVRDEERRATRYWLLVPWSVLGEFTAKAGARVNAAVAVHDADGRGREGALRWGIPEPGLTGRLLLR
ncbi:MAG: PQQ-binding-like beta-propeller repeat protein [Planctomycetota bacterium]